jgi:hypothetical protein
MTEVLQIVGAVLIVVAFGALQRGSLKPKQVSYLLLNLAGGLVLPYVAIAEKDWGFLLLEVVWSVVSAWSLVQVLRGTPPPAPAH